MTSKCSSREFCSPCMLIICPSLRAAPLTRHRVLTIRSAFASDSNGFLSKMATAAPKGGNEFQTRNLTQLNQRPIIQINRCVDKLSW